MRRQDPEMVKKIWALSDEGLSQRKIADRLGVSRKTVRLALQKRPGTHSPPRQPHTSSTVGCPTIGDVIEGIENGLSFLRDLPTPVAVPCHWCGQPASFQLVPEWNPYREDPLSRVAQGIENAAAVKCESCKGLFILPAVEFPVPLGEAGREFIRRVENRRRIQEAEAELTPLPDELRDLPRDVVAYILRTLGIIEGWGICDVCFKPLKLVFSEYNDFGIILTIWTPRHYECDGTTRKEGISWERAKHGKYSRNTITRIKNAYLGLIRAQAGFNEQERIHEQRAP